MKKIDKNSIEYRKKLAALLATGAITLTSVTGCAAKTTTESSSDLTVAPTTIETTVTPTTNSSVEVTADVATEDYMIHAKAVATAMYDNNKEYFDEKQFTVEDLENVYYILNGKYYDAEGNLIMEKPEVDRSFDIIRELIMPQRVNEMLQKYSDLEHGNITEKEYFDEVNASKFYDYKVSLVNFIDENEDNKDLTKFVTDYSIEMVKVTENIKNGVSPEEHLKEFFAKIRSAQTGDITDYEGINNYLQENCTKDGYAFLVAGMYKATADYLNTVIDGHFVVVPTKDGEENVRIGFSYDEQILVNAYYLGDLVETEAILNAKKLIAEEFQTMPFDVMCYREYKVNNNFGYAQENGYSKSL